AVQAAERRTRGEIVPMVARSSARYSDARYLSGLSFALLTLTVLLTWELGWGQHVWHLHHPGWTVLGVVLAFAVGYGAGSLLPVITFFTCHARMSFKVRRRVELASYEYGLHRTREGA